MSTSRLKAVLPGLESDLPLVLAPLDEISDSPFRRLARRMGADLVVSEFVSSEGLVHEARKSLRKLLITDQEHPVAVQVVGARIESVVRAAQMAQEAGADILDLNFGCPARKIAGKGAGAGMLKTPELLERMTEAVVESVSVPVTAKIRLGWDESSINVLEVCQRIERAGAKAVTIHARTRSQGFKGQADWRWIARARQEVGIAVIGNGDVRTPQDALRMFRETGCDGVMIGRAAIGDPWIFARTQQFLRTGTVPPQPPLEERFAVLLEHLEDAIRLKGERLGVIEMRKHYRGYFRGLPGAPRLREAMMEATTYEGVRRVLERYCKVAPSRRSAWNLLGDGDEQ